MNDMTAGGRPVFLYGTLRDRCLRDIVLGAELTSAPALLPDVSAVAAGGGAWPALVTTPGGRLEGDLVWLDAEGLARGDYYEGLFGYRRDTRRVLGPEGIVAADVWMSPDAPPVDTTAWDFDLWQRSHGPVSRRAAREAMDLRGVRAPEETARRWGMIRARAQAALNAAAEDAPTRLRRAAAPDDVLVERRRTPYAHFFAVEEYDLRFRRFDGSMSETVTRAAFISADAVTVLPYDPGRDRVLLIEQFRPGPFARSSRTPWLLEAIAGRIDAGETPEDTARREAREEAGLEIAQLIRIAGYYPSPGAKAEYLHSYLGLSDLPDDAGGLGGLASEEEDIRSHVLSFETLMALVASGEIDNAPLLLSAMELSRRREALRAAL
jgi:nudix-type nucleoside diphosphatase (YffH/AdpP family)